MDFYTADIALVKNQAHKKNGMICGCFLLFVYRIAHIIYIREFDFFSLKTNSL